MRTIKTLASLLPLALSHCGESDADPHRAVSRSDVVASIALDVAEPTFASWATATAELESAGQGLCPVSQASLQPVQAAWRAARVELGHARPFAFGPWVEGSFGPAVDFWPVRVDVIEAGVVAGVDTSAEGIAALGAANKGMPVLEYLVFDPMGGDENVLELLADASRCDYAAALTADLARNAEALHAAWDPARGAFATELADAGTGSEAYPSVQRALDALVNGVIFALQDVADAKMAVPLGSKSDGFPDPEAVESRFSDNARADISANLRGARNAYLGPPDGPGITDLVAAENPELDAQIRSQFEVTLAAIEALQEPLRLMVVQSPGRVETARQQVRTLLRLFEADVAALLGVTVSLNDNDGD